MAVFDVPKCETQGCIYWRIEDKCVLDKINISIPTAPTRWYRMHNNVICQIRNQLDKYRLQTMLEE